jgi:hypothetical protein
LFDCDKSSGAGRFLETSSTSNITPLTCDVRRYWSIRLDNGPAAFDLILEQSVTKYLRKWDNWIRIVFETERHCNCAFAGSGEFWGILTMSTESKAFMIFEERVCRVLTRGPRALIIAVASIGSLLLLWIDKSLHWLFNDKRYHSVEKTLTLCFQCW